MEKRENDEEQHKREKEKYTESREGEAGQVNEGKCEAG